MLHKSTLNQVLEDWNYWTKPPPLAIPRQVLSSSFKLHPDLVLVIQGVRRCGKSTLLAQIMQQLQLPPLACTFINFEDPRLVDHLQAELLDRVVQAARERKTQDRHYFFLDEIQHVKHWEKWLHQKTERPTNECFIVTGSNASLLSGELSTALTGRHITLELFPFDLHEFQTACPSLSFEDYLKKGGFPRSLTYEEPERLLREYFTDIIERDVRRHVAVRSSLVLIQLVKAVFESTGSEVSQRNLAKMLGVSADTIGTYLAACEAAYMLLPCPYFTFSEKQRAARHRKYYPIDLGMRQAIITQMGSDHGKNLETVIYHHLRKKYGKVFYWRKKGEIDFVTTGPEGIVPYQASWGLPKERHQNAWKEFKEEYPQSKPIVFINRENILEFLLSRI